MTGDPMLSIAPTRDPQAEAAITGGLAAYNTARFRPSDNTTLDVLVRDDNSGEILGGLLGHTSYRLFFLDLFYLPEELRGAGSAADSSASPRTKLAGAAAPLPLSIP